MKPVFQRIIDSTKGDCLKCCICSLFELDYDDVPNFVEYTRWYEMLVEFLKVRGYEIRYEYLHNTNTHYLENPTAYCFETSNFVEEYSIERLKESPEFGINGLFLASVYSPKFTSVYDHPIAHLHQVICDADCNIVFDPNPEYKGIIEYPYARLIGHNGIRAIDALLKLSA